MVEQIGVHSFCGANTVTISDMQIQYSNSLEDISTHTLTVPLATNYAVPILSYNSDP